MTVCRPTFMLRKLQMIQKSSHEGFLFITHDCHCMQAQQLFPDLFPEDAVQRGSWHERHVRLHPAFVSSLCSERHFVSPQHSPPPSIFGM